jgi:nucleoside-diphosphate-sugar epimerase
MKNKILIVGGAGYIGGYMTDLLLEKGHDVTVFDNLMYEDRFLKPVNFIKGYIWDENHLLKILPNYDTVVWLAAIVGDGACAIDPWKSKRSNEGCVKWLVDNYNGKIIFTSTCSVYGKNNDLIDETAVPNPLSIYAETKLAAEQYIIENCKDHLVFRLGTLYGAGDSYSRTRLDLVVNVLAYKAAVGQELSVFGGEQWRPLLHVRDVSEAVSYCLENDVTGLYNLSENNYRIKEIAEKIQEVIPNTNVSFTAMEFEDQRNYRVTNGKILSTGWSPKHDMEEGIEEIAKIFRENRISDPADPIYSNEGFLKEEKRKHSGEKFELW